MQGVQVEVCGGVAGARVSREVVLVGGDVLVGQRDLCGWSAKHFQGIAFLAPDCSKRQRNRELGAIVYL